MPSYIIRTSCEVAGVWRAAGTEIEMTAEQARELVPPFGNVLAKVQPQPAAPLAKQEPANDRLDGRKRNKRQAPKRLGARSAVDRKNTDDADRQQGDEAGLRIESAGPD